MSRRSFLRRSGVAGAALALPAFAAACGKDDEATFATAEASTDPDPTARPGTTATSETATSAPDPTARPEPAAAPEATATPTTATPTTATPAEGAEAPAPTTTPIEEVAAPAPGPLAIGFTYTMGAGGKQLAPYVAVWIEDTTGALERTVELWCLQDERRGPFWFQDLRTWFRGDQSRIEAGESDPAYELSSPTRAPGSYQVLWDGLDAAGLPGPDEIVVCVESARERGPYSLTSQQIARSAMTGPVQLADDEELSGVSVEPV